MSRLTLYDYCVEKGCTELLEQWHPGKNGALRPEAITPFSSKKVRWLCDRGHEYEAMVRNRTAEGSGCPYCANKAVLEGFNDLGTLAPEVAARWHPTKNGELSPAQVLATSAKKAWWLCEKGHEYEMQIRHRVNGSGCSVCAGRLVLPGVNDMASQFPLIAAQWHPTLNGSLRPDAVAPFSNRKVWWLCGNGHEYRKSINHRTGMKLGCPLCSRRGRKKGEND